MFLGVYRLYLRALLPRGAAPMSHDDPILHEPAVHPTRPPAHPGPGDVSRMPESHPWPCGPYHRVGAPLDARTWSLRLRGPVPGSDPPSSCQPKPSRTDHREKRPDGKQYTGLQEQRESQYLPSKDWTKQHGWLQGGPSSLPGAVYEGRPAQA